MSDKDQTIPINKRASSSSWKYNVEFQFHNKTLKRVRYLDDNLWTDPLIPCKRGLS